MRLGEVGGRHEGDARSTRAAFGLEQLYRELFPAAFRVAHRILGDVSEAEDAAAESIARAVLSWRRLAPLAYREAWVMRVASNVAIDMVRRRRPLRSVALVAVDESAPIADRIVVQQLLDALPRRQREVLALRYLSDLSEQEVAELLSISVGSVKQHAHRGLENLRAQVARGGEPLEFA